MSFQRFLNLVEALRQTPSFPVMDAVEERMLNALAVVWHADRRITVMEAMHMFPGISPSTVHRRLKSLRFKSLIALEQDQEDSRIKYVSATPTSKGYFDALSACMAQAAQAQQ